MKTLGFRAGRAMLLAIAVAFVLPAAAQAAEGFATANVNMRSGPSTSYPAVTVIPVGTPVEIYGCIQETPWCDVSFYNGRGWVAGRYVQAEYQQRRVYVEPDYYSTLGIPFVTFEVGNYWDRHYRNRSFYRDRDNYRRDRDYYRRDRDRDRYDRDRRPRRDDSDFVRPRRNDDDIIIQLPRRDRDRDRDRVDRRRNDDNRDIRRNREDRREQNFERNERRNDRDRRERVRRDDDRQNDRQRVDRSRNDNRDGERRRPRCRPGDDNCS